MEADSCEALQRLVRWESPLGDLVNSASLCDEDQGPPVLLDVPAVRDVLDRCIAGDLPVAELPRWAGTIHLLDRIEIDEADIDLLTQFLFEISSPELFEPVTVSLCQRWIDRLS